ncbi:MAG: SpoIIE family protein phosphatase [Acidobacteriota bacterium]
MAPPQPFKRTGRVGWVAALLALLVPTTAFADVGIETVTAERLVGGEVPLQNWLYLSASGPADAVPPAPSAAWQPASPLLQAGAVPADWTGSGWFKTELQVSPEVRGEPLGLRFRQHQGASRIFLDGVLLAEIGRLDAAPAASRAAWRREPVMLSFQEPGRHQLVIRFTSAKVADYHWIGYPGGFSVRLASADVSVSALMRDQRRAAGRRGLFTGVFLSFALLHALLFAFRPQSRENLYFASLCTSLALLVFLMVHRSLVDDPRLVLWAEPTMNAGGVAFAVFGVLFVHRVFGQGLPRAVRWSAPVAAAVLLWAVLRPGDGMPGVFLLMLASVVEMSRAVVTAVLRREPGARIVGLGIVSVAFGFGGGLLANLGFLPRVTALTFVAPFVSVLILIVSMSIYLSRRFALTQRDLEQQLVRVRELSQEKLEQERRTHAEQVRRQLAEAEVERKAEELEEARRLQLSMLPQGVPDFPGLDLAVHMSTATEVGGDYYDFDVTKDGTLTLAVGDATGHGMRAGTMVTATKSLFNALSGDPDLVATVKRSNLAIKRMNLRALNMALLLAKFKQGRLQVSAAGMPFPLIYRAACGDLESIEIGGMPLGSVSTFPYRLADVDLANGDAVLFMSDGFPERLNPQGELLGYDRAGEIFTGAARGSAQDIVGQLVEAGNAWAAGTEADDDVTFVVLKLSSDAEPKKLEP